MNKLTIFPDYDIIDHRYEITKEIEVFSHVRKQREDGVWFLIPVRVQYTFAKKRDDLAVVKDFIDSCYRTLKLWKIPKDKDMPVYVERPWMAIATRDIDQRDEKYRLNRNYLNYRIKVL